MKQPPSALDEWEAIRLELEGHEPALFLDYDGTLTPIVSRPEQARLSESMRMLVTRLADRLEVAVLSGRDLDDVRRRVAVDDLAYAGSHGLDIAGPGDLRHQPLPGAADVMSRIAGELDRRVGPIRGSIVERKRFCVAVHYRLASPEDADAIERVVDELCAGSDLAKASGKKVFEVRPALSWNKGNAVAWLLERWSAERPNLIPVAVGDDRTDEDMFAAIGTKGITILVGDPDAADWTTRARFRLADPGEVEVFLTRLAKMADRP